jgi:tetratricopeptide (TPR) repeat protein
MRRAAAVLALGVPLLAAGAGRADDLLGDAAATDALIETRVRSLAVHGMLRDADALRSDVEALDALDERRRDDGLAATGLGDDARYLAAALAPTRDAQREALHDVLDAHPDTAVRRLAEYRLEADDAAAADGLLADDRHNRRAGLLNDAVRPLGVFSGTTFLAAINPLLLAGSALDSVVTTAINLWNYDRLSTAEREALARYRELLEREPHTADAPEIARAIRRLGAKRAAAVCKETIALGTKALDAHDLDDATFYLRDASRLDGCADTARKPLDRLAEALAVHTAAEDAGRWPVDDPPQPSSPGEAEDYRDVLVAAAAGEPGAMVATARRFRERHDDSDLGASAALTIAAARDLAGHHDEAREALAEVARADGTAAGREAKGLLAMPDMNRLEAVSDAERRHTRDTVRYVLLGGGPDGRTAMYSAFQLGAAGLQAAQSIGMFNVIGVLTRAWKAWRQDPVSNQAIIDRGEEYLAREPHSSDAPAVHARLAEAYERAQEYGRALMHLRETPDPDPKRIAALEDKMAADLLKDAERKGGDPVLLAGIVRHFGTTKAADEARKKLESRPPDGETVLSRDVLVANPVLLGPAALDLDPRLLDGDRDNGELADEGVTLVGGEMRLALQDDHGDPRTETRPLSAEAYARARAAAQEALYTRTLTADRRDADTGRFERYVPFFLQGSVDANGGVSVYPGVKMRQYKSEDRQLYE